MLLRSKKFSKKNIFLGLLALFLILVIFNGFVRDFVLKPVVGISRIFLKWSRGEDDETQKLKEKIAELESEISSLKPLEKENQELKNLFSRPEDAKKYILAAVVSRPPQSPYDVFVIDAGSKDGVEQGMTVTAFSNILLGYVTDIFPKTSKVKLISFPGEETSVMIESVSAETKISAMSMGRGGGNMEIKIPSSIEIHSGDFIKTPGTYPLALGTVEKIETNLSDPFQKILFRLPINLQELQWVMIEK